jgi:aryl-alcohol dehydrogenase-like predicted oxidoreductase
MIPDWTRHPSLAGLPLVLGGNVFGWTIDEDASFAVLDAFYEAGGRMIDTAEGYSAWIAGHKGGESETVIGAWLESRGVRGEMRIGTKTGMGGPPGALAPAKLAAALQGSLERLRTDYVDLYYAHRDESATPLDEQVTGFDALVRAGTVRELGASNFTAERLAAAIDTAERLGATPYTVLQPGFNLVWRGEFPRALHDLCLARGVAVLPYYGLAAGYLTGKYRRDEDFAGERGGSAKMFRKAGAAALPVLDAIASETGASQAQVALAWLLAQPGVAAPLASGTSVAQVEQLCAAVSLALSPDQLARLTAVSVDAVTPPGT